MKNISKACAVLLSVLLLASSCMKEILPEGSKLAESQVTRNSEVSLPGMVNAIPVSMMEAGTAGYLKKYKVHTDFGIPAIHLMTEQMLEDLVTLGNNPYYNRFYTSLLGRGLGDDKIFCSYFWDCYYQWIKSVNDIIRLINKKEKKTPEEIKFLGTAYAYRAYFYLDLARMFEPKEPGVKYKGYDISNVLGLTVPIVTEKTTDDESKKNPRAPHDKMYEFILSDLEMAAKLLADVNNGYTSPTIYAVNGLFARAYLEMGAFAGNKEFYAKAAEYAGKVIAESGKTPLTQDQWEDPVNGFNNGKANTAWLWGLTLSSEITGSIISYTAHISSEASWGYASLSQIGINKALYEQIPDTDFRKHSWLDPKREKFYAYKYAGNEEQAKSFINGSQDNPAAADYENIKFRPAKGEVSDFAVGNCADHVLMRIEEMYFIKAEALAQQDKLNDAGAVLESLIKTRNPDYVAKTTSKEDFLDDMMIQKRIEFWGEGILFFDYKRLGLGIKRGYPGTNHPEVYCYNCEGRNPQWNIVITRAEYQYNVGIDKDKTNNPDPSGLLKQWVE